MRTIKALISLRIRAVQPAHVLFVQYLDSIRTLVFASILSKDGEVAEAGLSDLVMFLYGAQICQRWRGQAQKSVQRSVDFKQRPLSTNGWLRGRDLAN